MTTNSHNSPTAAPDPAPEPITPTTPGTAATQAHSTGNGAVPPTRPSTPDQINPDGSKTITTKRACNGCGQLLGDITDAEMEAAIHGRPLPDVRQECPACAPTAPPPACQPMALLSGELRCIEGDCDHAIPTGTDECTAIRTEIVCATHSTFVPGFEDAYEVATHAEPWPCKHSKAVTA
ncbi:hypothetical protein ACIQCF_07485 [Streptomyces sp. NPDC088353]|uniref:hypothetical protein n=1 Tax=Streptomyces sp. NPDC088353 TaxID=3365855 RepID=UPI003817B0A9